LTPNPVEYILSSKNIQNFKLSLLPKIDLLIQNIIGLKSIFEEKNLKINKDRLFFFIKYDC